MIASIHDKSTSLRISDRTGSRSFNIGQLCPTTLPNKTIHNIKKRRYPQTILHAKIIQTGDQRNSLFSKEKRQELLGLLERGAYRLIYREDAGDSPNIVHTRIVLAVRHTQKSESLKLKARSLVGNHKDHE